jgi:hypothetical protein
LSCEAGNRDTVAERVVNPPDVSGLGLYPQAGLDQSLIVAIPWAKHHPVFAKGHRPLVSIGREVTHRKNGHATCDHLIGLHGLSGARVMP